MTAISSPKKTALKALGAVVPGWILLFAVLLSILTGNLYDGFLGFGAGPGAIVIAMAIPLVTLLLSLYGVYYGQQVLKGPVKEGRGYAWVAVVVGWKLLLLSLGVLLFELFVLGCFYGFINCVA